MFCKIFVLFVCLLIVSTNVARAELAKPRKLNPFMSNGCSLPQVFRAKEYDSCCYVHDYQYWIGGTLEEKTTADVQLVNCIRSKGAGEFTAGVWQSMLEKFAMSAWGGDWEPKRGLTPLTPEEKLEVQKMRSQILSPMPVVNSYDSKKECSLGVAKTFTAVTTLSKKDKLYCYELTQIESDPNSQSFLIYTDNCKPGYFVYQVKFDKKAGVNHKEVAKNESLGGYGLCEDRIRTELRGPVKLPPTYKVVDPAVRNESILGSEK